VSVDSAGTLDLPGARPTSDLLHVAHERGVDVSTHLARPITDAKLEAADLALGMTLEHTAAAVVDGGAGAEKTFSLMEFVRHLEELDPRPSVAGEDRAREIVALVHEQRVDEKSFVASSGIEDPIGGPRSGYVTMAEKIEDLCRRLTNRLLAP
jgi:protein-tyrosine-phosphatase